MLLRSFVAVLTLGGLVPSSVPTIDGPATSARPATRQLAWDTGATCDLTTVERLAERHRTARQFVVVTTQDFADTSAGLSVATRGSDGSWACQLGPFDARVGRSGTRPLADRRSGDGTAPGGVFPLGTVTAWDGEVFQFFGNRPDPGVRGPYRDVRAEDCWGATPGDPSYQRLVARPNCPGPDDERLPRFGDVYGHAAVIGANLDPVSGDEPGEPALAAAIFLHRHSYDAAGRSRPTSGCVSLAQDDLIAVLRGIDPALSPHFAIGPVEWLRPSG